MNDIHLPQMVTLYTDMDIYFLFSSENYVKITPSVKMTSTLRSPTQLEGFISILTSSIETRTTLSTCSTCNKMSPSREDISSSVTTLSPLSSIMKLVQNAGQLLN